MNSSVDINQLVSNLAQKLGVAVDKVYPMLYKQAIINGVWDILWIVLSGLGLFFTFKWAMWLKNELKSPEKDRWGYEKEWFDYPHHIMPIGILLIILPIPLFSCMKDVLNIFLNTDWYIIQYAINHIR